VLVVRAWLDDSSESALCARITLTLDVATPGETVIVVSSEAQILDAVASWLSAFLLDRDR